jgi:CubicO group peptidase (beta-lactamase class C family)
MAGSRRFMNGVVAVCALCVFTLFRSTDALSQAETNARPTLAPHTTLSDEQIVRDLRASLSELVAQDRFSGAVLLAKGDQLLFEQAYGFADHAFNVPNKVDTKFNLGSMGKMFTAVAILQLAQRGKLSLNDVLAKVVPDYPNPEATGKITIRQLLTHTSGLGDFFGKAFQDTPKDKLTTIESHLPLFVAKPLLFEPGTKRSYSNAGFIVLGLVIEKVSEETYYDYVREHLFKPAGMINTDNYYIDADVPNLALGYTTGGPGAAPNTPRKTNLYFLQRGASAGGGYSTVEDLRRFADALREYRLLNQEYSHVDPTGKVATGREGVKYVCGLEEQVLNGVRIVGHEGGGPGINSNLDMYPDAGYVVAVMSNYDGGAPLVNEKLRLELTGQDVPRENHLPATILQSYSGKYTVAPPRDAPPGARLPPLEVTVDEQGLWINTGMGGRHHFLPVSQVEFFDNDSPSARLRFTLDQKGEITELTLSGVGPQPIRATKEVSR